MSQANVQQARAALQADPTQAPRWGAYIEALIEDGQMDEARKMLELAKARGLKSTDIEQILRLLSGASASPTFDNKSQSPPTREADMLVSLLNANRIADLEQKARQMTRSFPDFEFGWTMLGVAFTLQGHHAQALEPMRRAARLTPRSARAHINLGRTLNQLEHYQEAESELQQAIALKADIGEAAFLLGVSVQGQGRPMEAEEHYRQALLANPRNAQALTNLGISLQEQGRLPEAEECLRKAIALKPELQNAHHSLGTLHQLQGRFGQAEQSYRHALRHAPDSADIHADLGHALLALQRPAEAIECLQRALEFRPDDPLLLFKLGNIQAQSEYLIEAQTSYQSSLALRADDFQVRTNLANVLASLGRFDDAFVHYQQAVALNIQETGSFHGLTFCANYHPDKSAEEIYEAYQSYEQHFGAALRTQWPSHGNAPAQGRRLRIGYVSPDLRQHSVRHFLEPLLAGHDRSRFEVFAYAELASEDATTTRYRTYCDHFILTRGMSDAALADRIRADAIDVLVDLAGHTAGNRLLVFARKPAPVSLSWLGYGYTTGLSAIDYLLSDEASAPAGSEHLFSEAPWRLPCAYAFRPDAGMGEVSPLPAAGNGFVTFGTLTRAIRINHRTIRVWAEILKRVPHSVLVIDSKNFQHASMQEVMVARFAQHGVAPEQLQIGYHSPPWDTLRAIDIGLDCFPHNSGTTLFETLFMGEPFVTLAGRPSVGRLGRSILKGLGREDWLTQWCADSEEDYIDKAVALASDLTALQQIRTELRPIMQRSTLMDEAGFASSVEHAYLQMFDTVSKATEC